MANSSSKLTSKYQATIPVAVRKYLELQAGDTIAFEIKEGQVVIRKIQPVEVSYLQGIEATMSEWASPEDDEAYADL